MAVRCLPSVSSAVFQQLEVDARQASTPLLRRRSQIVLLAYELRTQQEVARAARCSLRTVLRTLELFRVGQRGALRRRFRSRPHFAKVTLEWQKALAEAMAQGPEACGLPRPTWTAPLLAAYLAEQTSVQVSERTVRRHLRGLGYVLGRPTYTVRHKAEAQEGYLPKRPGSKRC